MDSRRHLFAAALAAAFAALVVLVAAGALDGFDQYAVDHWMPGVEHGKPAPLVLQLVPFRGADTAGDVVADLVTLVGHPAVSLALCVALAWRFRSGREVLVGAFVLGVALETVLKHALERGRLYDDGFHVVAFDHAFPSGHAFRSTFLFLLAAAMWPRAAPWLAVWLAAIAAALVADGWHTPTDVAGGMLLATVLFLVAAPRAQPVTASAPAASSTSRSPSD